MINLKKAFTYFNSNYEITPSSNDWYSFKCPYHHRSGSDGVMAVNFSNRKVKCWGATCEFGSGFIDEFIKDQENLENTYKVKEFLDTYTESYIDISAVKIKKRSAKSIQLPSGFRSLKEKGHLQRRAVSYLIKRGFDIDYLDFKGFGYCNETHDEFGEDFYGYLIIPFQDIKGRFVYYIGRDFLDREPKFKYKNPKTEKVSIGKSDILYNELGLKREKRLFINEGWADAEMFGRQGIATLGWNLSNVQKDKIIKSAASELVFVPDVGFYIESVRAASDFIDYKTVKVLNMDLLKSFGKDTNEIGIEKVMELYNNTKELTFADTIELMF